MVLLMRNLRLKRYKSWCLETRQTRVSYTYIASSTCAVDGFPASRLVDMEKCHGKIDPSHVVCNIWLDARQKYRLWLRPPSVPN